MPPSSCTAAAATSRSCCRLSRSVASATSAWTSRRSSTAAGRDQRAIGARSEWSRSERDQRGRDRSEIRDQIGARSEIREVEIGARSERSRSERDQARRSQRLAAWRAVRESPGLEAACTYIWPRASPRARSRMHILSRARFHSAADCLPAWASSSRRMSSS